MEPPGRRVRRRGVIAASSAVARNRRLLRLEAAYALMCVFELGIWVTVLIWAYEAGGVGLAGLVSFVELVPATMLAPVGGLIGDRMRRDRALSLVYGLQGMAMGTVAMALATGLPTAVIAGCATVSAVVMAWTRPVHYAAMRDLSRDPGEAAAGNALSGTLEGGGYFVGPVLAGALIGLSGTDAAAAAFAAMALLGAVLTWELRLTGRPDADGEDTGVPGLASVLRDDPLLAAVLVLIGVAFVLQGAWEVLGVTYASHLDGGPGQTGLLIGSLGVGAMLGAACSIVLARLRRLSWPVAGGLAGAGLPLLAMPHGSSVWYSIGVGVVAGVGLGFFSVAGVTTLQRAVGGEKMGQVLGFRESALLGGAAIGAALAPLLVRLAGPAQAYAWLGAGLVGAAVLGIPLLARLDAKGRFRPRVVELLRRSSFLSVLDVASLESLAQAAEELAVGAGYAVVREGEQGDAYYLVESGRLEVSVSGRAERVVVDPGEGFGEIALLRRIPRTATVTATQPCVLWRLPREDFLRTVTGSAAQPLADLEARDRLDRLAPASAWAGDGIEEPTAPRWRSRRKASGREGR